MTRPGTPPRGWTRYSEARRALVWRPTAPGTPTLQEMRQSETVQISTLRERDGYREDLAVAHDAGRRAWPDSRSADLVGQRYGRLVVLARVPERRRWRCRCACGVERIVYDSNLKSRRTASCGCCSRETPDARSPWRNGGWAVGATISGMDHGEGALRESERQGLSGYGGRGITMFAEWRISAAFRRDVGASTARTSTRPSRGMMGYALES